MKCIPPELKQLADEAERRREEAIERLARRAGEGAPSGDPFLQDMEALIDADKRVVRLHGRRRR